MFRTALFWACSRHRCSGCMNGVKCARALARVRINEYYVRTLRTARTFRVFGNVFCVEFANVSVRKLRILASENYANTRVNTRNYAFLFTRDVIGNGTCIVHM